MRLARQRVIGGRLTLRPVVGAREPVCLSPCQSCAEEPRACNSLPGFEVDDRIPQARTVGHPPRTSWGVQASDPETACGISRDPTGTTPTASTDVTNAHRITVPCQWGQRRYEGATTCAGCIRARRGTRAPRGRFASCQAAQGAGVGCPRLVVGVQGARSRCARRGGRCGLRRGRGIGRDGHLRSRSIGRRSRLSHRGRRSDRIRGDYCGCPFYSRD